MSDATIWSQVSREENGESKPCTLEELVETVGRRSTTVRIGHNELTCPWQVSF